MQLFYAFDVTLFSVSWLFVLLAGSRWIEAEVVAENGIEVDVSVGVGLDVPEEDFPNFQLLALFVVEAILLCVAAHE